MRIELDSGDWVDLREATFGDIRYITKHGESELDQTALLLTRIITAWSYDRAVDEEGVDALSLPALTRLSEYVQGTSAGTKEQTAPLDSGSTSNFSANTNSAKEPAIPAPRT